MNRNDDDWAVFWCSLLGPILLEEGERRRFLKNLSQQEVLLPNGQRKRISLSTLRRKVRQFRASKIDGLRRKKRRDRGGIRKNRIDMIARAIELKKEQPYRSPLAINEFLRKEFGRTIPKPTMNRHLRRAGATRRKLGATNEKIRCRWTRDHTGALWVGDFSEGPYVFHAGRIVKTHLSIWIDCHSRYVMEGRYYFRENLDIVIDSLLRAWGSHGASREIYVDNAKVYHANALKLACAQLNIHLLHRPPREPSPGGIIERIIQTTQGQFEKEVRASHTISLEELNRYFQAWLHASYHNTVHSQTDQTPRERFQEETRFRRHVNLAEVLKLFWVKEKRKVHEEFVDVQVNSMFFRADVDYRGDRVMVHYDPFSKMDKVELYSLEGQFLQAANRYERERGAHPEPPKPAETTPLDLEYLKLLEERYRQEQQAEAERGVDYHAAEQRQVWSTSQFAAQFAKWLGRKGGISGLSTDELQRLTQFHGHYPRITMALLQQAFEQAEVKTIPVILFHLQSSFERNR